MKKNISRNTKPSTSKETILRYKHFEPLTTIAQIYGFSRLPPTAVSKQDEVLVKQLPKPATSNPIFGSQDFTESITVLQAYVQKAFAEYPHPPMFFYEGSLARQGKKPLARPTLTFDVLNCNNPLIDVACMHLGKILLETLHPDTYTLELNSVGDKESNQKFNKELGTYYKKHAPDLSPEIKNLLKKDVLSARLYAPTTTNPIQEHAPQTIHHLSELSTQYVRDILTYLSKLEMEYTVNPRLIPDRGVYEETVFTLTSTHPKKESPYIVAVRYNTISKKLGLKKEIPTLRMMLVAPKVKGVIAKETPKKTSPAPFYFVQIGLDAKLKSLQVLEQLRKAKIPVQYSVIKDKLIGQLSNAEQEHAEYILLMGQKECLENTILVRNTTNSSQETVALTELVSYLKKLKVPTLAKK